MENKTTLFLALAVIVVGVVLMLTIMPPDKIEKETKEGVQKFTSLTELQNFIKTNVKIAPLYGGLTRMAIASSIGESAPKAAGTESATEDYSTTNIQVAGVDEADIVKNDGKYIYTVSGYNKVVIVNAYPAENAKVISTIEFNGSINQIYINKDRLIVFGYEYTSISSTSGNAESKVAIMPPYYRTQSSVIKIYDVSDRAKPVLKRTVSADGNYYESRMVDNFVYVIFNQPVYYYGIGDITLPAIKDNGVTTTIKAPDIYYFDYPDNSYNFVNILSLDVQDDDKEISTETFLMSYTQTLFVSQDNIYITYPKRINPKYYFEKLVDVFIAALPSDADAEIRKIQNLDKDNYEKIQEILEFVQEYTLKLEAEKSSKILKDIQDRMNTLQEDIWKEQQKTIIHRIAIENGKAKYKAEGEVPGSVLNQFSMDEYQQHFRIATTTDNNRWWGWGGPRLLEVGQAQAISSEEQKQEPVTSVNNLYVLNMDMKVVGKLEDLAPNERIYSARFLGDRAYLVTFKRVDPLFVIDLSNPAKPEVLGKLKIPGFSDYLHPYDENHIIGIGQEVNETTNRILGIKLALFDVSDVEHPVQVANYVVERQENSYSSSEALYDHKAFLFSKQKNLLVIPVTISIWELEEGKYEDKSFYGAYVFKVTDADIDLKGKITHVENETTRWDSGIRRSLYMDDVLYTVSNRMIKMNSLSDLTEINKVQLPESEYPVYYAVI
ncbi:beta-propeller domain-containing protein [Candidatus Pacearchaeota archaeon]|nr:beta-propeller domain-containing protein [Candidatus Pacearchaeota archaeon]